MKRRPWSAALVALAVSAARREICARPSAHVRIQPKRGRDHLLQFAPNGEGMAIALRAGQWRETIYRTPTIEYSRIANSEYIATTSDYDLGHTFGLGNTPAQACEELETQLEAQS